MISYPCVINILFRSFSFKLSIFLYKTFFPPQPSLACQFLSRKIVYILFFSWNKPSFTVFSWLFTVFIWTWYLLSFVHCLTSIYSLEQCNDSLLVMIFQDGSCNGLQHYAALGRDTVRPNNLSLPYIPSLLCWVMMNYNMRMSISPFGLQSLFFCLAWVILFFFRIFLFFFL